MDPEDAAFFFDGVEDHAGHAGFMGQGIVYLAVYQCFETIYEAEVFINGCLGFEMDRLAQGIQWEVELYSNSTIIHRKVF